MVRARRSGVALSKIPVHKSQCGLELETPSFSMGEGLGVGGGHQGETRMQYTRMGSTGAQVSRLCLGCMSFGESFADWTISEADSLAIVRKAVEAGINFFDTADAYGRGESEEILGRALKTLGVRREEVVIATKIFAPMSQGPNMGGLSRKHIAQGIDASLKRLGVDYIDLYQIHRFDYGTPMEETIAALDDAVRAGKLLYLGASSMHAYQFAQYLLRADHAGRARFATMQNHYNLLYREEEREMIPLCEEECVGLIPWSPLAGGRLAGSREAGTTRAQSTQLTGGQKRYSRPEDQAVVDAVRALAEARGETPAQVAIAWLLAKPAVTAPILGVTKLAQLDDPVRAVDAPLSADEVARLDAAYTPQPLIGPVSAKDAAAALERVRFGRVAP
jgi:aryl-alcohol dehydrogenase-like predicted oxidoreductase